MVGVSRREDIVGNVGSDVGARVAPFCPGGDAANAGDDLLLWEVEPGVGVALDLGLGTRPGPVSVPGDTAAGSAVDVGALIASAGSGSPLVVVEVVPVAAQVGILVTQRLGHCQRQDGSKVGDSGLHCGRRLGVEV